jgi:hypothetical protein
MINIVREEQKIAFEESPVQDPIQVLHFQATPKILAVLLGDT